MTLERILSAAVASMITGHHAAHCYRAHVRGKGYVNDGTDPATRAEYLVQLERDAESEVENLQWYPAYAQPYQDQHTKGIVAANWNVLPRNLDRILERAGYAVQWSDMVSACDDCGRCLETTPTDYCWQPWYSLVEGCDLLCLDCLQEWAERERANELEDAEDD